MGFGVGGVEALVLLPESLNIRIYFLFTRGHGR
jgi:hypothetical protein